MQKEEDILAVFEQIKKDHGGVDVCVNNAGLSSGQSIIDGTTEGWKTMLDVKGAGLVAGDY